MRFGPQPNRCAAGVNWLGRIDESPPDPLVQRFVRDADFRRCLARSVDLRFHPAMDANAMLDVVSSICYTLIPMSSDLAVIVGPDQLCAQTFLYFQAIFRPYRTDVSKVALISHLPPQIYGDRQTLGAAVTGALLAMLDHRKKSVDWSSIPMSEVPKVMPPELLHDLDEILIAQGAITGVGLLASGPVMMRVLHWERHDYRKTVRWLRSLNKAARVQQRLTAVPLDDPFLRDVKKMALAELRPVVARLQKWFQEQRVEPGKDEVIEAFRREASAGSLPWMRDDHNLKLWIDFVRVHTRSVVTCSAEKVFDDFAGFVTGHDSSYTRKKFSRKR